MAARLDFNRKWFGVSRRASVFTPLVPLVVIIVAFILPAMGLAQASKKLPPPTDRAVAESARQIAEVYKKELSVQLRMLKGTAHFTD